MKFSIRNKITKEKIITIEYKKGKNKWLLAIRAAIDTKVSLSHADMRGADMSHAHMRGADMSYADMRGADMSYADMSHAHMRGADMRGANIDFSSGFSFKCSSFNAKIDLRLAAQLAYHFCRMDCQEKDFLDAKKDLTKLANKFHRVKECGNIK